MDIPPVRLSQRSELFGLHSPAELPRAQGRSSDVHSDGAHYAGPSRAAEDLQDTLASPVSTLLLDAILEEKGK